MKWLIVGGDGQIGGVLVKYLRANKESVIHTTRINLDIPGSIFLDLANLNKTIPINPDIAILCIGVSNILFCEKNPEDSFFINVRQTLKLARSLIESGVHVIFLSSSAVFDGKSALPSETSSKTPTCEYGRQKSIAEDQLLLSFPSQVSIIRLTKVLSPSHWLVQRLRNSSNQAQNTAIFNDYFFSPTSLDYVVEQITTIAKLKIPNIFHLSSDTELSYYDFALTVNKHLGTNSLLITPQSCANDAILVYRPEHTALNMSLTKKITKTAVCPQSLSNLICQLHFSS